MTAKNFPSIGPMLKNRSSSSRGVGTNGTPIKQSERHTEKIYPAFSQHPFALWFIPAKFHVTV
jgi:hypothetical protein